MAHDADEHARKVRYEAIQRWIEHWTVP